MLAKVGGDLEAMTRKILLRKLHEHHVRIMTETKLSRIEKSGVWVMNKDNTEHFIETERVVLALGYRADSRLHDQVKALGYEVHQIGDCVEPRNAKAAIYEGAVLGRLI